MAKVQIAEADKAPRISSPEAFAGSSETRAFFKPGKDPIQLHLNRVEPGRPMRIGPTDQDCISYVWEGAVEIGGEALPTGSSFIVEHGACAKAIAGNAGALLLTFAGNGATLPSPGGRIHLMPRDRLPYANDLGHDNRVAGGMHANAEAPSTLWLHENSFPPPDRAAPLDAEAGVHCHTEDEVIFVVAGNIQLGPKLYGPGTAVGIAANTYYSFTPGPAGLKFINFRPGLPSEIRMRSGFTMDEIAYWKDRLPAPQYITMEAATPVGA
jgi:hypothetical protein